MSLTWHIIRKDLTRLRLPLAIWSAVQFFAWLGPEIIWALPPLPAVETQFLVHTITVLGLLSSLAAAYVAIQLIQEDSPNRADAFWRTRPLSGVRLLGAKLLGIVLFSVLAALPSLIAILLLSSAPLASASSFLETALLPLLLVATPLIPIAALCRSFRQSLLATLVAFIALVVVPVWIHIHYDPGATDLYQPRLDLARIIALVTTGVLLLHQYTTARVARSLCIAGAGIVLIALVLALWPWRFPLSLPPLPAASSEPADAHALSIAYKDSLLWDYARGGPKSKRPHLNLEISLTGVPANRFLSREAIYHHWQENDPPSYRKIHGFVDSPDARAILGLLLPPTPPQSFGFRTSIPEKFATRLRSGQSPGPYRADIVLNLHRAEITEIPLSPDHFVSTADSAISLLQIDARTATLHLLERRTPAQFHTLFTSMNAQFILYNPHTGEALRGSNRMFGFPSILFSVRSLQYHELTFAPIVAASITNRTERLTDEFLRDARLVKITFPIVGTLTRTIEVPAFAPKLDVIAR